jgi:hypothetical protein
MTCPGSIRMSEGIPNRSSRAADEGTEAHALAETVLRAELNLGDETTRAAAADAIFTATTDMLEAVAVYVDKVLGYAKSGIECEILLEQRVSLDALGVPIFGTADALIYVPAIRRLIVGDYKHGAGVAVEVEENYQLKMYALAAWQSIAQARGWIVETVETFICQPRKEHADGPVRSYAYTLLDLLDFAGDVIEAVAATQAADAPLVAGEHCRFCAAKPQCPARVEVMREVVPMPAEFAGLPKVSTLSVDQCAQILTAADRVGFSQWLDDVRGFLQAHAEAGNAVPNFKLVAKRAARKWKEADSVIVSRLTESTNVSRDQLYTEPTLKTVAQIEKLVGKKNLPAELTVKESSGYNLVPETAAGAPVLVHPGDEFDAIEPA